MQAEIQAILISICYYAINCSKLGMQLEGLEIETDCQRIEELQNETGNRGAEQGKQLKWIKEIAKTNNTKIRYRPRETNTVAHNLAQHGMMMQTLTEFSKIEELPPYVKGCLKTDIHTEHIRA